MKGLLTKDFALFFQRKRTFIFLALWAVVMSFTVSGSFAIGWMTIIASFFAISSLSYDEYDNCYPMLMSLPIDGKTYAIEKYLFAFLSGFGAWLFSCAVNIIALAVKGELTDPGTDLIQMAIFIPVFMILIDISLPLNMKFGSERGRMAILIIWGVIFVGLFLVSKLPGLEISIDESLINGPAVIGIAYIAAIILTVVSMFISIKVMSNKEY
ncbi:MAG: ABC-2 transporter permease [Clostridia bacterium]|nr:ABC-2 transporter permease [Clostridia bacterium]